MALKDIIQLKEVLEPIASSRSELAELILREIESVDKKQFESRLIPYKVLELVSEDLIFRFAEGHGMYILEMNKEEKILDVIDNEEWLFTATKNELDDKLHCKLSSQQKIDLVKFSKYIQSNQ